MSRILKVTPDVIEQVKQEFAQALLSAKMMDGKFSFTKVFEAGSERATLRFEPEAYAKMVELVKAFDKEVAWHFVCRRGEAENEYVIYDIVVYPQSVSAATVDMDVAEYTRWLNDGIQRDDERFFNLFGQGHSHVNMATSPSGTDMDHQKKVLGDLLPRGFYIFVIWNKRNEHTCWVYDLAKNIVFENKDIDVCIGDFDLTEFIAESKELVKTKTYTSPASQIKTATGWYSNLSTPATVIPAKVSEQKKEKEKVRATVRDAAPIYPHGFYDDDEDDPTSPFYVNDYYYGTRW